MEIDLIIEIFALLTQLIIKNRQEQFTIFLKRSWKKTGLSQIKMTLRMKISLQNLIGYVGVTTENV
jgi:hypothetical protein